jgi:hypothetical protein
MPNWDAISRFDKRAMLQDGRAVRCLAVCRLDDFSWDVFTCRFVPAIGQSLVVQTPHGCDIGCVERVIATGHSPVSSSSAGGNNNNNNIHFPLLPHCPQVANRLRRDAAQYSAGDCSPGAKIWVGNGPASSETAIFSPEDILGAPCVVCVATHEQLIYRATIAHQRARACLQVLAAIQVDTPAASAPNSAPIGLTPEIASVARAMHVKGVTCQADLRKILVHYDSASCLDTRGLTDLLRTLFSCRIWMHHVNRSRLISNAQIVSQTVTASKWLAAPSPASSDDPDAHHHHQRQRCSRQHTPPHAQLPAVPPQPADPQCEPTRGAAAAATAGSPTPTTTYSAGHSNGRGLVRRSG